MIKFIKKRKHINKIKNNINNTNQVGWQNSAIDLGSKYGSKQSTHYINKFAT